MAKEPTIFICNDRGEELHSYQSSVVPVVGDEIWIIREHLHIRLAVVSRVWSIYDTPTQSRHRVALLCCERERHPIRLVSHVSADARRDPALAGLVESTDGLMTKLVKEAFRPKYITIISPDGGRSTFDAGDSWARTLYHVVAPVVSPGDPSADETCFFRLDAGPCPHGWGAVSTDAA